MEKPVSKRIAFTTLRARFALFALFPFMTVLAGFSMPMGEQTRFAITVPASSGPITSIVVPGALTPTLPAALPCTAPATPVSAAAILHIAVIGDSLTAGTGTSQPPLCNFGQQLGNNLPPALAATYAPQIFTQGIGGYRTAQMLPAVTAAVFFHPDIAIVELGSNDERWNWPVDQMRASYGTLLTELSQARGINTPSPMLACLSLWPSPGFDAPAQLMPYDDAISQECQQFGGTYIDITALATTDTTNINTPDQSWHPNDKGAALIARTVMGTLLAQHALDAFGALPATSSNSIVAFQRSNDGTLYAAVQDATLMRTTNAWVVKWYPIGTHFSSDPHAIYDPLDKSIEVLARGDDGNLYVGVQNAAQVRTTIPWEVSWYSIGGDFIGNPAVLYNPLNASIEIAARRTDGELFIATQDARQAHTNAGWVVDWYSIGGNFASDPALVFNPLATSITLLARGADQFLYVAVQDATMTRTSIGWVVDWYSLSGVFPGAPVALFVASAASIMLYVRGINGDIFAIAQDAMQARTSAGWSAAWSSLGGIFAGDPAVVFDPATGSIGLYARGADGTIFVATQDATRANTNPGPVVAWYSIGGSAASDPTPVEDLSTNSIEVFTMGWDGNGHSATQDALRMRTNASWVVNWHIIGE